MKDVKDAMMQIQKMWDIKRQEEASTMFINRKPTEDEIERAMIIGKWFFGWDDTTGTCPIKISNEHWHKKVCALLEWIAMLESELQQKKKKAKNLKNTCSLKSKCVLDNYAYSTIEEFEKIVGCKVNESFRIGWDMARTKNRHIGAKT